MADLFVSYRRDDARWAAGRICDCLITEFGKGNVFLDTIAIEPGEDFVEAIGAKVEGCRVLLAVLGPHWLAMLRERLDQGNDYVRIELAQAISRGIRVIPITIDDVSMPREADLPHDLATLARRNAVAVRADTFRSDIAPLVAFMKRFLDEEAAAPAQQEGPVKPPEADAPKAASLRLGHRTEAWKLGADGRPRRKIFVWLEAAPALLDAIEKVVYMLHPTFKNPKREIFDRQSAFELRTNGWGEFEIKASVYFLDGRSPVALASWIKF